MSLHSQTSANLGSDFYVAFGRIGLDMNDNTFQIKIFSPDACQVTFTYSEDNTKQTVNIAANSVYIKNFTPAERNILTSLNTGINSKSVRIQSTEPIKAYAYTQQNSGGDASELFPTDKVGTNYFHLSYKVIPHNSYTRKEGFLAVATQNNTTITVILPNGTQETPILLQAGEVYTYLIPVQSSQGFMDISGTQILSDKPIVLYTHPVCSSVETTSCDCIFEQHLAVETYGKSFLVPVTHRGKDRIRVIASENATVITQNGGTIISTYGTGSLNLNKGQFVELEGYLSNKGVFINSNKPVLVANYMYGHGAGNEIIDINGDPSLVYIPALDRYENQAKISAFTPNPTTNTLVDQHYAIITTPTATKNQTTMQIGTATPTTLSGGTWYDNSNSGHSYYILPITNNQNTIYSFANANGMIVFGYGTGEWESYFYCAGRKWLNTTEIINLCQGESFQINGHTYSETGIYCEMVNNQQVCYDIRVFPKYNNVINAQICDGATYTQNGFNENKTGTYKHNFKTVNNCDSIITLNLTVYPRYNNVIDAHICEGETYNQNGFNENKTGTYTHNFKTANNCDSIITLNLTVLSKNFTINANICDGKTYNQNGFNESQTGVYTQKLLSSYGCDSIVTLNLTVAPNVETNIQATICDNKFYTENGFNTNKSGQHRLNLKTIYGCDSVVNLNLTVLKTSHFLIRDTICQGSDYQQYGFNLTNVMKSDTIYKILPAANGCDSIITLIINVVIPSVKIKTVPNDFCENRSLLLIAESSQQNIIWSTGETSREITVTNFGFYNVSVNDGKNCKDAVAELLVRPCVDDLLIPNCITPNGDEINDTWVIDNIDLFESHLVYVFNRWGQQLFSAINNYKPWDGKYKGRKLPAGTYMYYIQLNNGIKFCGTLTIIY